LLQRDIYIFFAIITTLHYISLHYKLNYSFINYLLLLSRVVWFMLWYTGWTPTANALYTSNTDKSNIFYRSKNSFWSTEVERTPDSTVIRYLDRLRVRAISISISLPHTIFLPKSQSRRIVGKCFRLNVSHIRQSCLKWKRSFVTL